GLVAGAGGRVGGGKRLGLHASSARPRAPATNAVVRDARAASACCASVPCIGCRGRRILRLHVPHRRTPDRMPARTALHTTSPTQACTIHVHQTTAMPHAGGQEDAENRWKLRDP